MKTTIALSLFLAIAITANAQTITLHSSSGVLLFTGNAALQSAYTAAQNTDTLYLSGGTFTPPSAFDKQLFVYGAGHYVDSSLATGKTFINGNVTLQENADLFHIEGLEITGNITFADNHSINNVNVIRCKINGTFNITGNLSNPSNNLALIGNVFLGSLNLTNATNVLISNNSFSNVITYSNGNQISNNIFLNGAYSGSWGYYVIYGNNNQLANNISIFTVNHAFMVGSGNIFYNNLFVSPSPAYGTTPTVIDNYIGVPQEDIFVDQTGNTFNYAHNYHLQAPATYIGNDGFEVGFYGGMFPYKEGAVPSNPHIRTKSVSTQTNAAGEINVNITVGAQDN